MKESEHRIGLVENEAVFRDYFMESMNGRFSAEQVQIWNSAEAFINDDGWPGPSSSPRIGEGLDVLFIDINLPHMNGIDLARRLSDAEAPPRMIMLTSLYSDEVVFKALQAGAVGYVLKSELPDLGEVVEQTLAGGSIITPTIAFRVLSSFRKPSSPDAPVLTERERQILEQICSGMSTRAAAELLGITVMTLRTHIRNIYRKLNVSSKIELMRKATRMGLI